MCPALDRFGIVHTGIGEAHAPYQIVRTNQTTSYFLACFGGRGRVLVDGRWRIIRPGLACLLPAHAHNAFEALPGDAWRFAYACYQQGTDGEPKSSPSAPVVTEFEPEPLRMAIEGLTAECRGQAHGPQVDQWLELVQSYVRAFMRSPSRRTARSRRSGSASCSACTSPGRQTPWRGKRAAAGKTCAAFAPANLGAARCSTLHTCACAGPRNFSPRRTCGLNAVAQAVGYTDALAFSNAFKAAIGCRPSEYRQNAARQV